MKNGIGILGGAFDPIHFGHLQSARDIKAELGLQKVIFVPSYTQPLKMGEHQASAERRLEMTRLAVEDFSAFKASDFEVSRAEISYTVTTLEHFGTVYPAAELWFIMGADSWAEITEWRNYTRLFDLANMVVTSRPGYEFALPENVLPVEASSKLLYDGQSYRRPSGNRLWHKKITDVKASSTEIRRRIKMGETIEGMTPQKVIRYIKKHKLYK